jgi:hypothetical protein
MLNEKGEIKNPGAEELASSCPQTKFLASFPDEGVCWSNGVVELIKSQTPSTKSQTNFKFQYPMTKRERGLGFRILVIVICLIFVICDLEFLILQIQKQLAIYTGKAI